MFDKEENKDRNRVKKMPVYIKANEICTIVIKLSEIVGDEIDNISNTTEKEMAKRTLEDMLANAYTLPVKIAGAEAGDIYDLRMENAAIIRKAARELSVGCTGLKMLGVTQSLDYFKMLREEIELFRVEFAEWVKTFDPWNYIIDRWGLFNPPGVNFDDHDPDDDIPFNPNDLM